MTTAEARERLKVIWAQLEEVDEAISAANDARKVLRGAFKALQRLDADIAKMEGKTDG